MKDHEIYTILKSQYGQKKAIKMMLEACDFTTTDLADKAGVSPQAVNDYFRCKSNSRRIVRAAGALFKFDV